MKKLFQIIIITTLLLTLTSCTEEPPLTEELEEEIENLEEQIEKLEDELTETEENPSYITLNSPSNNTCFHTEPITFSGTVSPDTEKIVATASFKDDKNQTFTDTYTLQEFEYGDSEFTYRAKLDWDNLGWGETDYTFTAHFDNGKTSSTNISISFKMECY